MTHRLHTILLQLTTRDGALSWQWRVLDPDGAPVDEGWFNGTEEQAERFATRVIDAHMDAALVAARS